MKTHLGALLWAVSLWLFLPQIALADDDRLATVFRSICVETFPDFAAIDAKVSALGGWLDEAQAGTATRIPFVNPRLVKKGSTGKPDLNAADEIWITFAEGTVANLPAAGCDVTSHHPIDQATITRLLEGFGATVFMGRHEGSLLTGPYRTWVVQPKDRRALLTVTEPQFGGKAIGTSVSLVRLDETLFDQLVKPKTAP